MPPFSADKRFNRARLLILVAVLITLGFSAIFAGVLVQMGRADRRAAVAAANNVLAAIGSDIARNIEVYDLSLQAVVDGLKLAHLDEISPELRQMVLFDRAATAKNLGSILVLNRLGDVTSSSQAFGSTSVNLASFDFFKVHEAHDHLGLYLSQPWVMSNGAHVISLSRRISNADGSFAGVVVGNMMLAYFHNLFRNVSDGSAETMTLMNTDRAVLMHTPFQIEHIGRHLGSTLFQYFPRVSAGSYEKVSLLDGVNRLFVYQQVANYPLVLVSGLSIKGIYAEWRKEAALIGALVLLLCAVNVVLVGFLARELRRRGQAEDELIVLARTDGLTGLCNRRGLDERFEHEWALACRQQSSVAVLMIDADGFKACNDRFGHQTGDRALIEIAGCIASAVRRPADLCARYGGEEFVVMLPGVSLDGARQVAETIRAGVHVIRDRDPERPDRLPTVSIGVAIGMPRAGQSRDRLIEAADTALYVAKENGRDRIELSVAGPSAIRRAAA